MNGELRKPMMAGVAALALVTGGWAKAPKLEGEGYGGKLALAAARAAVAAEPDRSYVEHDLRDAEVAAYDADRDGALSFAEWLERSLAPYLIDDVDGDGRVSFREYMDGPALHRSYFDPRVFRELDRDRDGYISVKDRARKEVEPFREADRNEDGKVTDDEIGITKPLVSRPQVAVSDLVGLTPNQLRVRFGLPPSDSDYVTNARLDGETVVTVIDVNIGGGGACTNHGSGRIEDVGSRAGHEPDFVFRDGNLADVTDGRDTESSIVEVVLRCHKVGNGDDFTNPFAYVLAAPFLPMAAFYQASYKTKHQAVADALAAFRLGEPPPGGLAAYARIPPKQVTVTLTGEGAAEIAIKVEETNFGAAVSVRDGRVVAIVPPPFISCIFGSDLAFHC